MTPPFMKNVSSRYGAPMGRRSDPLEHFEGKVHFARVPFVDGDYDPGGAYWGAGDPLYAAWDDAGHEHYIRARSRSKAKAAIDAGLAGGKKAQPRDLDDFLRQYLETAVWTTMDDEGNPIDREYSADDFSREAVKKARKDAVSFIKENKALLDLVGDYEQHGHDFWLTRNRHGAGFWDRGYSKEIGDRLTKSAHVYGEVNVYVSRGKLFFD
jgi:hypothetical protein